MEFVSVVRGAQESHYLIVDPMIPADVAAEIVRRRAFVSDRSTGRRAALGLAVALAAGVAVWLSWSVVGWREPPSFVAPALGGAAAGSAAYAGIRVLVRWIGGRGRRGKIRAGRLSRASARGALEYVPSEVRRWARAGQAPVADVVDLARACVATRSALTSIELWREATSHGSWAHANAVVGPIFAAEYEARRAELDELAARLGFAVPADLPPSLED